jgi:hypothetical protein
VKVTHTFEIEAKCPSMPGHTDIYQCTLTTHNLIEVETIRPLLERALVEPQFQEDLAVRIAELFQCAVRLEGQHPGGFKTVVEVA